MTARRLAVIAALWLGALIAPANASAAFEWDYATAHSWYQPITNCAMKSYPHPAIGCWEHNGDWLDVGDLEYDHMRAGMHWKTTGGRVGMCVNTHGVDASYPMASRSQGDHACNKNFPEGNAIQFRVARCDGSKVNCEVLGNWRDWSAWSPWFQV